MNTTTFKRSPIQPRGIRPIQRRSASDFSNKEHSVRTELRKLCVTYQLTVTFEEDAATLDTFKHVPGLIAVLCTLRKDNRVISQGRSWATLNRMNKFIDRAINSAINGSFLSAANNATKVLDALRLEAVDADRAKMGASLGGAYIPKETYVSEPATDRQKAYANRLLAESSYDEPEREQLAASLDQMTKEEISELIQRLGA
ncbi:hypothetical protein A2880_02760 [Candidatus Peribacteria bacterium RIFCSPHIGHO2_01_FULL_49_38]|nr:MAG: hypothetical protein A2880_02760 [Candidatus Peribacteria bacterium RIFCSPHIGHO2_01_FULL_49_38]